MSESRRGLTYGYPISFAAILIGFTALNFVILQGGLSEGHEKTRAVAVTTASTISGPFVGAISRGFQSCCLEFSMSLLPYAGLGLAVGTLTQFGRWRRRWWAEGLRLSLWSLGWFVWFASGIVSYGHALG